MDIALGLVLLFGSLAVVAVVVRTLLVVLAGLRLLNAQMRDVLAALARIEHTLRGGD